MPTGFNCIQEIEFRVSFSRFTHLFKQLGFKGILAPQQVYNHCSTR